jgi:hypothetical protein
MAASLKEKRTPITTPRYQVPIVDIIPDPPIFSLFTTFKGIVQPVELGGETRFIPSTSINRRPGKLFFKILMTESHERNIKQFSATKAFWDGFVQSK